MAFLVDSDIVIDHLVDNPDGLPLFDRLAGDGLAISKITYMEVCQGPLVSPDPLRTKAKLDAFLADFPIVSFSDAVAWRCARLRADLQRQRKRVRPWALDLLTAAAALEHGLTLVTRNLSDSDDTLELAPYRLG